jgi:hypothetical protein
VPRLTHTQTGISIDEANAEAIRRIIAGRPAIVGLGIARDVIPGMTSNMILHAGPPIEWDRMCGPTRGAVMGALVYEGLAETPERAAEVAASGEIVFEPCHHHHAVGPMAGVVSPSMPVWIIEIKPSAIRAYCTLNEACKVLRYGAYGDGLARCIGWHALILRWRTRCSDPPDRSAR